MNGGQDVNEVIAALQNELAMEQAKNAVLLEKLLGYEDELSDARLEEFSDVIPNEDRNYWRSQFLENSKAASEFLGRLRNRIEAPAGGAAPAKQTPRPMHNRAAAPMPKSSPGAGVAPSADQDLAAKIRNRAQEIANRDRISFTSAFSRAERELRG